LLDNPERAEGLAAAGREYVQQYAWHAVRRRLLEVYSALAPKALDAVAATTK
jgi:glycosyltransferase involved in cell wall biosynthesis